MKNRHFRHLSVFLCSLIIAAGIAGCAQPAAPAQEPAQQEAQASPEEGTGEETAAMIALCRKLVEEKGYSCAFGTAYYDKASQEAMDIRTLMKDADAKMYEDKRRMKEIAEDGTKTQIRSVIRSVK